MWDVWDVGYLRCGMFWIGMFAGKWDVDVQNSNCRYKILYYVDDSEGIDQRSLLFVTIGIF